MQLLHPEIFRQPPFKGSPGPVEAPSQEELVSCPDLETALPADVWEALVQALMIRIGFGDTLYSSYHEEPPKPCSNY